ncbi:hypothetical protein [Hymenobacter actinosclerus]|uniref:NnrS protein n=1 Tax=Hymenobacter actinosclerus TaxID=82805 RepID=A0A1I0F841_9BACT|nr:hypothetical protein [Hymenobacter actinosclerus]SET54253.1 hypothetical protein SAMN04487998_2162 [Hymenobacter actinosclerus]
MQLLPDSWPPARRWVQVALINLVVAALLGALMRYIFLWEVPGVEYRNIMHAHSHGAMLGWVYLVLFTGYVLLAGPARRVYTYLFWATQLTVVAIFVLFALQGYSASSIAATSLHVLLSYVAVALLWPDLRRRLAGTVALPYLLAGLGSIVLSTLGLWALGIIMSSKPPNMTLFYLAIQFFLHGQLNGWFMFGTLGLVVAYFEKQQLPLNRPRLRQAFILLLCSLLPTYGLAVAWAERHPAIYAVTALGVLLQLLGVVQWLRAVWPALQQLTARLAPLLRGLWAFGIGSLAFKALVHAAVAVPYVAVMSFTVRNFVIGFVHLVTLGATTLTLLALLHGQGLLSLRGRVARLGAWLLLAGFVLTEMLLFLQGLMLWLDWSFIPSYHTVLLLATLLLPAGALLLALRAARAPASTDPGAQPLPQYAAHSPVSANGSADTAANR